MMAVTMISRRMRFSFAAADHSAAELRSALSAGPTRLAVGSGGGGGSFSLVPTSGVGMTDSRFDRADDARRRYARRIRQSTAVLLPRCRQNTRFVLIAAAFDGIVDAAAAGAALPGDDFASASPFANPRRRRRRVSGRNVVDDVLFLLHLFLLLLLVRLHNHHISTLHHQHTLTFLRPGLDDPVQRRLGRRRRAEKRVAVGAFRLDAGALFAICVVRRRMRPSAAHRPRHLGPTTIDAASRMRRDGRIGAHGGHLGFSPRRRGRRRVNNSATAVLPQRRRR